MMVHFRSRFSEDHQRINSAIIAAATGSEAQRGEDDDDEVALKSWTALSTLERLSEC